ncbi:hypothetical protein [Hymenobacter lapidiphilus]|uniref:Uncharacterized protein n=1 Tax=Hymenobacter lapidiphilus TaxID=2608003 RepID=A0A7Y7PLQ5_9BACT|nr:hypothetical protein [Hymenobacter lapidiphilus]NVO30100.1 hypothetical protein [Hymenobacter lapidiphilus]
MPSTTTTTVSPVLRRLLGGCSALLLGLLLTACAPSQTLSVVPAGWGRVPVTSLISHPDSVYVRFHFVRAEPKELVFEAEFSNAADHPVTIDPAGFYFLPLPDSTAKTAAVAATAPASAASRRLAFNPELRLDSLADRRDELADKASRVSMLEVLLLVASTAENVASINRRETPIERTSRQVRQQGGQAFFEVQRVVRAVQAQQLTTVVAEQAVSSLRRAILQPGDRAVGLVYFPRLDAARQLRFVLAFDEQPVSFDFTQETRKLNGKLVSP